VVAGQREGIPIWRFKSCAMLSPSGTVKVHLK